MMCAKIVLVFFDNQKQYLYITCCELVFFRVFNEQCHIVDSRMWASEKDLPVSSLSRRLRRLITCPFTGPKMFCADPNFLSLPKNLAAFSATSKTFVPAQKTILLNANHLLVWHKMFVTVTICNKIFGQTQKIWTSTKHFGTCKRTRQNSTSGITAYYSGISI